MEVKAPRVSDVPGGGWWWLRVEDSPIHSSNRDSCRILSTMRRQIGFSFPRMMVPGGSSISSQRISSPEPVIRGAMGLFDDQFNGHR